MTPTRRRRAPALNFASPLLSIALFAAGAAAQQTYVVAPRAGPGVHFTSLPAAVQAATSGDTVLLRAGTYAGFTTSKGLTILGDPGATIDPAQSGVTVVSLPAGETFALRGVRFACSGFRTSGFLGFQYNAGRVHLESVTFSSRTMPGIGVNNCAHVTMTNCSGNARGCLQVASSTVSLVDCTFLGEKGLYLLGSPPAVDASRSTVVIAGGRYRGGDGEGSGPSQVSAAPGIICRSGTMVIAGRATSVEAGFAPQAQGPVSALVVQQGASVDLEPAVQLVPRNGAGGATGAVARRRIPSIVGAASAASVQLVVHAPQGRVYGLVVGFPVGPVALPFGSAWLQTATAIGLASGVVGATELVATTLPVQLPLGGLPLVFHAVTLDRQTLELSPPCVVIVP